MGRRKETPEEKLEKKIKLLKLRRAMKEEQRKERGGAHAFVLNLDEWKMLDEG